jgi:hypothetical protein
VWERVEALKGDEDCFNCWKKKIKVKERKHRRRRGWEKRGEKGRIQVQAAEIEGGYSRERLRK